MFSVQWSIMLTHIDLHRVQCLVFTLMAFTFSVKAATFNNNSCFYLSSPFYNRKKKKVKTKHTSLIIWLDCCFSSTKAANGWHVFPYKLQFNSIRYSHFHWSTTIGMVKRTHFLIILFIYFLQWSIIDRMSNIGNTPNNISAHSGTWIANAGMHLLYEIMHLAHRFFLVYYWFWWFDGSYPGNEHSFQSQSYGKIQWRASFNISPEKN